MTTHKRNPKLFLSIFILVVLASGWLGVLLDTLLPEQPKGNSLGMLLWLTLPFITMIVFRIIGRDWKDMGITPNLKGNGMWHLMAFLIYPIVTIITVGLAFLFRNVSFSHIEVNTLLSLILFSVLQNFIKNIFEEFSWRGYLTPKLIELKINDWGVYFISGLVWALWHAAYYLEFLPNELFESISRVDMLLSGCVLMIAWSVMYVEIYRLTKSVWPCILMHALEDAIPTALVMTGNIIIISKKSDFWLNPISGVLATILFLAIGIFLRAMRIKKETPSIPNNKDESFYIPPTKEKSYING